MVPPNNPPGAIPPNYAAPPPGRGTGTGKIVGLTCGCLALILVIVSLASWGLFRSLAGGVPPPPPYVGMWIGADGTALTIRADGRGDYRSGGNSISGGKVKVNEAAKTLEIGLFGINKQWHIDQPPHEVHGNTEMTLSGLAFRRMAPFSAPESRTAGGTSP